MPEMPDSREDHGQSQLVCRSDHVLVLDRPARLDHGGGPGIGYRLKSVRKRKERIGGGNAALKWKHGLHGSKTGGVNTAHLSGANTERLAVAGVNNRVRFD